MSITVWAAPASRLQSRHVLRFLKESRLPIRAVEVRLFMYNRAPAGSRRWEPIGDLARTAEDISQYIVDSGSPQATIIRDEAPQTPLTLARTLGAALRAQRNRIKKSLYRKAISFKISNQKIRSH
jgi:hypothetical protein